MARRILSRRFLAWYYGLLLIAALLVAGVGLSLYRAQPTPAPGTLVLLVSGRTPSRVQAATVELGQHGSWRRLVSNVSLTVPAAPATFLVARVTTPSGVYDAVRVGTQEVAARVQVAANA